jgi:hypothetical protein
MKIWYAKEPIVYSVDEIHEFCILPNERIIEIKENNTGSHKQKVLVDSYTRRVFSLYKDDFDKLME